MTSWDSLANGLTGLDEADVKPSGSVRSATDGRGLELAFLVGGRVAKPRASKNPTSGSEREKEKWAAGLHLDLGLFF